MKFIRKRNNFDGKKDDDKTDDDGRRIGLRRNTDQARGIRLPHHARAGVNMERFKGRDTQDEEKAEYSGPALKTPRVKTNWDGHGHF